MMANIVDPFETQQTGPVQIVDPFEAQVPQGQPQPIQEIDVDRKTGAPIRVREFVWGAPVQNRLSELRRFYPDAQPYGDGNFVYTNPDTGLPMLMNPPGFDVGDIPQNTRAGFQAVGGAMGAAVPVVAAPATGGTSLLAEPVAAGLGTTAGGMLYDSIRTLIRGGKNTQTPVESMAGYGADFLSGAAGQRAGSLVSSGVKNVASGRTAKALFTKGTSPNLLADYATTGVIPQAGTVSGSKGMQLIERMLEKYPSSAKVMRDSAQRTIDSLSRAPDDFVERYGTAQSMEAAGGVIRRGGLEAAERFTDRSEQLYRDLYRHIPREHPVNLTATKSFLENEIGQFKDAPKTGEKLTSGIQDLYGRIMADLPEEGSTVQFKTLMNLRSAVGRSLKNPQGPLNDLPRAQLSRLYGALTSDIERVANETGKDAARSFNTANRYYRMNKKVNLPYVDEIFKKKTDEEVYKWATGTLKDGSTRIRGVMRNLKPEQRDVIRASVLQRLGIATPGVQGAEGTVFSADTFLTNWNKMAPQAKDALFSGGRFSEIRPSLDSLARVAESIKLANRSTNYSNTGTYLGTAATLLAPLYSVASGDIGSAAAQGLTIIAAPYSTAKLLTSPAFVKWLSTSLPSAAQTGPNGIGPVLGRLASVAKSDPEIREEIIQYTNALRDIPVYRVMQLFPQGQQAQQSVEGIQ